MDQYNYCVTARPTYTKPYRLLNYNIYLLGTVNDFYQNPQVTFNLKNEQNNIIIINNHYKIKV